MLRTSDIATSSVDTATDIITVAGVTVPATGTPVFYRKDDTASEGSSGVIGGLTMGTRYITI
jgi:hypothetical protein